MILIEKQKTTLWLLDNLCDSPTVAILPREISGELEISEEASYKRLRRLVKLGLAEQLNIWSPESNSILAGFKITDKGREELGP